jgi:D-tyrosyl-tRNA(Tyr) deacylase
MRAVVQRVSQSEVRVAGELCGRIERGLLVLLGVSAGDTDADARFLADKLVALRVFNDNEGKMNLGLLDVGGAILVVSQFTLLGDCRKGRRPSYSDAAAPELAEQLYERFAELVRSQGVHVETGRFRQDMQVSLTNDGPVTLLLDSRRLF